MSQNKNHFIYKLMVANLKIRDMLLPREVLLDEINLKPGDRVLDFGCGPGSYTVVAAQRIGPSGRVFSLDIHPLALQYVQKEAEKRHLTNIETILSDGDTCLPDASIDYVFLFDILHALDNTQKYLAEFKRVLKPGGILCVNDHHMQKEAIITLITAGGMFNTQRVGEMMMDFGIKDE